MTDTGCGKTSVVQLLAFLLQQELSIVNCHATTEISDLIGGLRPVRSKSALSSEIVSALRDILQLRTDLKSNAPAVLLSHHDPRALADNHFDDILPFAKSIASKKSSATPRHRDKRQRVDSEPSSPVKGGGDSDGRYKTLLSLLQGYLQHYMSLFEWADGPLVSAMKRGSLLLLDEMSLADDAVLERLNSVLEPSRTLVLAEKGGSEDDDGTHVVAHREFQLFATMNPGGDFGKRELSPALRSRFTEIWVPPVQEMADFGMVISRTLATCRFLQPEIRNSAKVVILKYVEWFNGILGTMAAEQLSLSLRDIVTWATFVVETTERAQSKTMLGDSIFNGARLMHLDGLGLGSGLALDSITKIRSQAETFLSDLLKSSHLQVQTDTIQGVPGRVSVSGEFFGADPYWISLGSQLIEDPKFHFYAETTAINVNRVIRAMQLSKPILLEGPPGVGKVCGYLLFLLHLARSLISLVCPRLRLSVRLLQPLVTTWSV